jgi:hypothetical protein
MSQEHCLTDEVPLKAKTAQLYVALCFSAVSIGLLVAVGWNFYKHVYKKNVWRNKIILIFYVLAALTALCSAIEFALWAFVDYLAGYQKNMYAEKQIAQTFSIIATIALLNIGFF